MDLIETDVVAPLALYLHKVDIDSTLYIGFSPLYSDKGTHILQF